MNPRPRPRALITGASSGIGAVFADQLAAAGHDLVLVARRRGRLEHLTQRLPVQAEVVAADLSTTEGLQEVTDRAGHDDLDLRVSNAGTGGYHPLAQMSPQEVQRLLTFNALAPVELARAALPHLLEKQAGGIITVASLLAFSAGNPAYSFPRSLCAAANAATVAFTRQLAVEVAPQGVTATVVCPGLIDTEWGGGANHGNPHAMDPRLVVRAALTAHARGEVLCIPGLEGDAALRRLQDVETELLIGGGRAQLASRYQG